MNVKGDLATFGGLSFGLACLLVERMRYFADSTFHANYVGVEFTAGANYHRLSASVTVRHDSPFFFDSFCKTLR
jgi:hypothetical protein